MTRADKVAEMSNEAFAVFVASLVKEYPIKEIRKYLQQEVDDATN